MTNSSARNTPQNVVGCVLLRGYPTFSQIINSTTAGLIALYVCAGIAVAVALLSFISELKYMQRYMKQRITDRHQQKVIQLQVSLPIILGFSALIVCLAPRLSHIVAIFSSIYFAFAMFGFARMIFNYFGGVGETEQALVRAATEISYQAFPLTICCFCFPKVRASRTALNILKWGVQQAVIITFLTAFINPAILLDGSICSGGVPDVTVLKPIKIALLVIDLVSSLIAMTALTALANATESHLTKYRVKQKFMLFKLCLLFFRIQPAILGFCSGPLRKIAPTTLHALKLSEQAWLSMFNSYLQVFEFFLVALLMRFMLKGILNEVRADGKTSRDEAMQDT